MRKRATRASGRCTRELFANQKALTTENLEKFAKEIGLNMKKFKDAIESDKYASTIQQQQTLSTKLGARGTPAFFINGRNLRGAQPLPAFEALIDEELKKAKALVDGGTPRSKVYATTIAKGLDAPKAAPAPSHSRTPTKSTSSTNRRTHRPRARPRLRSSSRSTATSSARSAAASIRR